MAIAYSDDFVCVYNIADVKPNAVVYPLLYADLTLGVASAHSHRPSLPKSVLLRFQRIFTHLKVIHNVHNVSATGTLKNSSFQYQRFLLAS
ncbi:hypothetical protein D8L93_07365 [Sodalis-like symbiont of Bactericera trigonica]|nr:hypothetical protein D8L93_07365 [Sodalis-like symbiont of Bactericera trigonica]